MKEKRYSEEQIVRILQEADDGKPVAEVFREYGGRSGGGPSVAAHPDSPHASAHPHASTLMQGMLGLPLRAA